jgi:hypothetical protein
VANAPAPPSQMVEGLLHQGCEMILGGTIKSNKSWCLLDLAISVGSGQKSWGRKLREDARGLHQFRAAQMVHRTTSQFILRSKARMQRGARALRCGI